MNPHISINWLGIAFPVIMTVIIGVQLWRRRPRPVDRLSSLGLVALILALTGASVANLFYQRALDARIWPTTGMFDQLVVTSAGDIFVKVKDPIMVRASRVQRYTCRGEFKAAFQPDHAGGLFKIAINPDNTLSIYSVRTDTIDTFSADGTFLRRREVDSQEMPFEFLRPGPSVTRADGCEFTIDPTSGRPAVKTGAEIWPLERGDWALEYVLNRQNIIGIALLGGLMLLLSYLRGRSEVRE